MIVTVQLKCIFKDGDVSNNLINYSRCVLSALKGLGYKIAVYGDKNTSEELEIALNHQMIPYESINSLPIEQTEGITYNGIIRITHTENFSWLEVRDNLKDILMMDYPRFYDLYCTYVMNEPCFHVEEKERIVNEMSQS